jgi:hypothetical protein
MVVRQLIATACVSITTTNKSSGPSNCNIRGIVVVYVVEVMTCHHGGRQRNKLQQARLRSSGCGAAAVGKPQEERRSI